MARYIFADGLRVPKPGQLVELVNERWGRPARHFDAIDSGFPSSWTCANGVQNCSKVV